MSSLLELYLIHGSTWSVVSRFLQNRYESFYERSEN